MHNQVATLLIQQDPARRTATILWLKPSQHQNALIPTSSPETEFFCEILHLQLKQVPNETCQTAVRRFIFFTGWVIPDFTCGPDVNIETNAFTSG